MEEFLIRTVGGPHPGDRVANAPDGPQMSWPLPDTLPDEGGHYRKVSESKLPAMAPGLHVKRGAMYEWVPDDA